MKYFCTLALLCMAANGAPPAPPRLYQQHVPAHIQNIAPLDYFGENSEVAYYGQGQHSKGERAPARLESLEPDSEVELLPGAQQPQQPPQQSPVSPNLPGLVPGQRVFIVHMPVPGYRPGTIGGYQPLYIVAAAPQGNTAYAANGYQNAVLVNPAVGGPAAGSGAGQVVPLVGYPHHPSAGLLVGAPLYRGFEPYLPQVDSGYYQQAGLVQQQLQHHQQQQQQGAGAGTGGAVQLAQLLALQRAQPLHLHPADASRNNESAQNANQKRVGSASESIESKEELSEESQRNSRPHAPAQSRNKV